MRFRAEHFDWLGLFTFPFIFFYGYNIATTGKLPSENITNLLVIIGIAGTLIDGGILYNYFIKKDKKRKN
jgi:hypothetical protein